MGAQEYLPADVLVLPLLPAQGTGPGTTSGHVVEETFEQQRPHSSEKKILTLAKPGDSE